MHLYSATALLFLSLLQGCSSSAPATGGQTAPNPSRSYDKAAANWLDKPAYLQRQAILDRTLSVEALTRGYLERISQLDSNLHSIIALNPDALEQARAMDQALATQHISPGPLYGLPVLLKDNIETLALPTTAGSQALRTNDTRRDAPLVANLRAAGAIILGKTNLSEWANFRSESSVSGWSGVGGLTRNPYNLARSACGSSSGSGAAISADLASLAVGTETNGSIICPSAFNGIVGFKPTVGAISRRHIVPISASQDTAGPMVKTVTDAALMASIMAARDNQDEATLDPAWTAIAPLPPQPAGLKGKRVGVVRFAQGDDNAVITAYNAALQTLEEQGAELVELTAFKTPETFWEDAYYVLLAEFKTGVNAYLADSPAPLKTTTLAQLIAFNQSSEHEMVIFNQDIFEQAQATEGATGDKYQQALARIQQASRQQGIDKLIKDHQLDILVAPTNQPAFLIDLVYGDHAPNGFIGIGYLAAIAGYPHLTVPSAMLKGIPIGLSFIGAKWQDNEVLAAGQAFEAAHAPIPAPTLPSDDSAIPVFQPGLTSAPPGLNQPR
ncbi:amidase [Salinimonas sediminis]|uniref:Amidase n=1 Tax=Salinimonas sediminis TaxID=2303538 RepID=A0A346NHN1_9ALTE|nr:amidase [Salinimonas sediminis]AXR05038.1 amidase [Salinimonas sediminis]